jgi:hypothetical protein
MVSRAHVRVRAKHPGRRLPYVARLSCGYMLDRTTSSPNAEV